MEPDTFTIATTHGECLSLLASARVLAEVKQEAVARTEAGFADRAGRRRHRAELAEVRDLLRQLEKACDRAGHGAVLTGPRALLDEIVHGALVAACEALTDSTMGLDPAGAVTEVAACLALVKRLLRTLTKLREAIDNGS